MRTLTTSLGTLLLAATVLAQHYEDGPVHIMSPWSPALPPVSKNGAAYVTLMNHGDAPERLVGASSPIADRVELHGHMMEDGVMKMRPVEGGIALAPGEYVKLEPGGNHIMLMGLKQPLKAGEQFPLTLEFENAAPVQVTVTVQPLGSSAPTPGEQMHHGTHGSDKTHGHDQMQMQEQDAEQPQSESMNVPAAAAPTVALDLDYTPGDGYTIKLATTNFQFSEQHADGGHIPGEGHANLYVDGIRIGHIYAPTHKLGHLGPGTHEVAVGLFTNHHMAYVVDGHPVSARVTVRVLPADERASLAGAQQRIDLSIHNGKVNGERNTVRVEEGDLVKLRWTSDAQRIIHLHGYDIEMKLTPGVAATMQFDAVLTGRFPVETHGAGHGHRPLVYVEVYPK